MKYHKPLLEILCLLYMVPTYSYALETCQNQPLAETVRAAFTPTGLEKITKRVLDDTLVKIAENLKKKTFKPINFPCKIPQLLYGQALNQLLAMSDSVCEINNLQVKELHFEDSDVNCQNFECNVTLPFSQLKLTGDIKIFSPETKKTAFSMNNLSIGFKEAINDKKEASIPKVKFKSKFNADGKLQDLIQIQQNSENADVSLEGLSFTWDPPEKDRQLMIKEVVQNIFKTAGQDGKNKDLTFAEQEKIFWQLFNDNDEKVHKTVTDEYLKELKKYGGFQNETSVNLFVFLYAGIDELKSSQQAREKLLSLLQTKNSLQEVFGNFIGKHILPSLTNVVNPELQNLPFVHQPETFPMPLLSPQDIEDEPKQKTALIKNLRTISALLKQQQQATNIIKINQLEDDMSETLNMLSDFKDPNKIQWLEALNKTIINYRNVFLQKINQLIKNKNQNDAAKLLSDYQKQDAKLGQIQKNLFGILEQAKIRIAKDQEQVDAQMLFTKSAALPNQIELGLTACVHCSAIQPAPIQPVDRVQFKNDKSYDLAFQASLDNFNRYMQMMFKKDYLKFCMNETKDETCANSSLIGSSRTWITAQNPPTLIWKKNEKNDKKSCLALQYNLQRETTFLTVELPPIIKDVLPTNLVSPKDIEGSACVQIKTTADGKKLYLEPTDSDSNIALQNSFENANPIDILKNLTIVLPLAQNLLLDMNQSQINQEIGQQIELPQTLGISLVDVQTDNKSIIFYTNLNN